MRDIFRELTLCRTDSENNFQYLGFTRRNFV